MVVRELTQSLAIVTHVTSLCASGAQASADCKRTGEGTLQAKTKTTE